VNIQLNEKTRIMSGNEFEKQVQQRMSGWKLPPGEQVWVEVEKRIRKEKRRRTLIFFILFFLLLGGGASSLIVLKRNNAPRIVQAGKNHEIIDTSVRSDSGNIPNEKRTGPASGNIDTAAATTINIEETKSYSVSVNEKKSVALNKKPEQIISSPQKNPDNRMSSAKTIINQTQTNPGNTDVAVKSDKVEIPRDTKIKYEPNTQVTTGKELILAADSTQLNKVDAIVIPDEIVKNDPNLTNSARNQTSKSNPGIEWLASVYAGRSAFANGFRIFSNNVFAANSQSLPPVSPSPGTPQEYRPAISAGVNLYAKQNFSPRLSIEYGAGYSFLSTKIDVGNKKDSSGVLNGQPFGSFYSDAGTSSFTNKFHTIELSAELSWKIIKKENFSLSWDNGLRYNGLFASDVLHYNSVIRGYYRDPAKLTQHHLFLSTGLSFPVSKKISIQPFMSYSLTRVFKSGDSANVHFSNPGIRVKLLLGKKNK
jgi:hypothetical protein